MKKIILIMCLFPILIQAQLQRGVLVSGATTSAAITQLQGAPSDTSALSKLGQVNGVDAYVSTGGNGLVTNLYVISTRQSYARVDSTTAWVLVQTTATGTIQHDTVSLQINSVTFTPTPSVDFTAIDNAKIELYALSPLDLEVHRIFFNGEVNAGASVTSKSSTSMVFNVNTLVSGLTTTQKQSILYKLIIHK